MYQGEKQKNSGSRSEDFFLLKTDIENWKKDALKFTFLHFLYIFAIDDIQVSFQQRNCSGKS